MSLNLQNTNLQNTNEYEKIIHDKDDIILKKNTLDDTYYLEMQFINNVITLDQIYNFNLYHLLFELNKDILENVAIKNDLSDSSDVLIVFKQFGIEFGIPQKYMCLNNSKKKNGSQIIYIGKEINNVFDINPGYEKITIHKSLLNIEKTGDNFLLKYEFNIDIHENLPKFMENIIGLLIKNIFIRFKHFIESYK